MDLHYRVILTSVNKIEAMFEGPGENVKFEQGSMFTFTRGLPFIKEIKNHVYGKRETSDSSP